MIAISEWLTMAMFFLNCVICCCLRVGGFDDSNVSVEERENEDFRTEDCRYGFFVTHV